MDGTFQPITNHPITQSPQHPITPTPRPAGSPPARRRGAGRSWQEDHGSHKSSPLGKIEWAAGEIGDAATCLFDNHGTGSVVPDLLAVIRPARGQKPRENLSAAGGQDGVLRLAVDRHR